MGRRLTLLLIVYVTLDFANPLMPGAVRFSAGVVEIVEAHGAARPDVPAPEPDVAPPVPPVAPPILTAGGRPRSAPVAPPRRPLRQPAPRGSLASPSPDDH